MKIIKHTSNSIVTEAERNQWVLEAYRREGYAPNTIHAILDPDDQRNQMESDEPEELMKRSLFGIVRVETERVEIYWEIRR